MGINRFSTTGTTEYTPQHVPLPFDTISKVGEQVKLEHDTADAAASAAKTDIQGGLATQEHAKVLNTKKNALLQAAQARAEQTGNYGRLTQDIKEIASTVQNDPLYQGIQRDIAITKLVNQQRMDPNFKYSIQNYADEKGNVKQLGLDQQFDESYYNIVNPGNRNAERKSLFDQMKPIVSRIYEQPVTKTWEDEYGKIHTQTLQEGTEAEGLRRAQVKEILSKYIKQDPNALNTQSYMYDKARLAQQGKDWTPEDELEASANAFMGEFYNEKDIQKLGADKVTSPLKDDSGGSGSGSGKIKDPIPNAYTGLLSTNTVVDEHLDGLFRKNEDGTHTVPLQGSIMNFAKTSNINPEENKIMTLGQSISKIKGKYNFKDPADAKEALQKQNPKFKYIIGGGDVLLMKDGEEAVKIETFPGINYTKEELAQTGVKSLSELNNQMFKASSEYNFLKEGAKQKGINIESPEFQNTYKKGLGKYTEELNTELGNILELGGEAKFIVDEGENKINVDGKPYIAGKAIMTKEQLNNAFSQVGKDNTDNNIPSPFTDEWEEIYLDPKGTGFGLIKPYGTDKDGNSLFAIDIKKEIPVSRAINKTYNKNVYSSEYTSNADNLDKSYDEFLINELSREMHDTYASVYTNNKKAFDANLNKLLEQNKGTLTPQLTNILNAVNAEKDPNVKKEKLIAFSLKLKNGEAEDMVNTYLNTTQAASPGKNRGSWTTTPATPLKK